MAFFVVSLNLSLVLSGISKSFYTGLFADANLIMESVDAREASASDIPISVNDINIDSYAYYQNLNMEAKSENFLDLYLIEDKSFLLRSIEVNEIEVDFTKPDRIMTYVVKPGDSLGKIANQFGINTETIRTANSLKKNTINPGQELVILPISGIYYTVKKGDTLGGIALKNKISASVIREYNNLSGDTLKIGEKIILPGAKETVIVNRNTITTQATKVTETTTSSSDFFIYPTVG